MNNNGRPPVHIYTEASPNPGSMKFVFNFMVTPEGRDLNFIRESDPGISPLATHLFAAFPWLGQVFFLNNFVTLTRTDDTDWYERNAEVRALLTGWFSEGKPVVDSASQAGLGQSSGETSGETDLERQIIQLLDEYVRPAVEGDGGAIAFHSFSEGVVKVELRGSCSGCPSSALTLKQGIENLLTRMVPEVREVVAVNR
jgi:Fe-S cluster biogenesis protein NfuA